MLAVAPAAQGRGVGETLVQHCIDAASRAGRNGLFIYSGSWMAAAHRLYGRLGFQRRPERDWLVDDPPIHLYGHQLALSADA
jgi:predicted N-acetyltransferase YhbS